MPNEDKKYLWLFSFGFKDLMTPHENTLYVSRFSGSSQRKPLKKKSSILT